ncbi:hypothetical protein [Mangrovimonas aestuarii]|uniref:hypothetical protein n=1 Tax=Mangrovimonas aestuarii TaxID=3018443 RepID=UPI002379E229|nr:hypothetical protein [Mangrovimonas aestuarii]
MKQYRSQEEIEHDLKRLNLERKIVLEELKGLKMEFKEDLKPLGWIETVLGYAGKFGSLMLLKKLFK